MNKASNSTDSRIFLQITLTFVFLTVMLGILISGYWYFLLKPRLHNEAMMAATLIGQAQAVTLTEILQSREDEIPTIEVLTAIDKILLSKDPITKTALVRAVALELDYDILANTKGSLDLTVGDITCTRCFVTPVPLYSPLTDELLGIARFHVSDSFFQVLENDIKTKLYAESAIGLLLLILSWRMVISLSRKLELQTANRKQAENALHIKDQQYRRLINQLSQYFIYSRKPDGELIDVSSSVSNVLDYPDKLFQGNIRQFLSNTPINDSYLKHLTNTNHLNRETTHEVEMIDIDGNKHTIEFSEIGIQNEHGEIVVIEGIGRDITDTRHLQRRLELAKETAENANRAKSDFLANMSHEIRTPMNAILGLSYLALKTNLNDQQHDYVSKISSSAKGLLGIINDILDFSKIEAGRLTIEDVEFDLNHVLIKLTHLCTDSAEQKGLEFVIDCPETIPRFLVGDPLRLGQVLLNLTSNAIKFTERGKILLSIKLQQQSDTESVLEFSVNDTGIGMSETTMQEIFNPFSQADASTTRRFGGTGLGLSISQRLVAMMNGAINAESKLGKGSRFYFTTRFKRGTENLPEAINCYSELKNLHILIVDNNQTTVEVLIKQLGNITARVDYASSGQQAITMLENATLSKTNPKYDLVLMDWSLPGLNGIKTIQQIRNSNRLYSQPKIIIMTAFGTEKIREQAGQMALDGVITKPISTSDLLKTLTKAQQEKIDTIQRQDQSDDAAEFSQATLLVVEDNAINQQIARELLESKGFNVVIAENGKVALEAIHSRPFDAVLLDLQMPVMDGYQTAREIRRYAQFGNLPIIAMTAHTMTDDKQRCLAAGMNEHISKPIDPDRLYALLQRWITVPSSNDKQIALKNHSPLQNSPMLPVDLPGINQLSGLNYLSNNSALYRKLLIEFHQDYRTADSKLQQLLEQQDYTTAIRLTHTLKSVSANLGAIELLDSITVLESALKNSQDYRQPLAAFTSSIGIVMRGLEQIDNETGTACSSSVTKTIDFSMFDSIIQEIIQRLSNHSFHTRDILPDLQDALSGHFQDLFQALKIEIDAFRFDQAEIILEQLESAVRSKYDGASKT